MEDQPTQSESIDIVIPALLAAQSKFRPFAKAMTADTGSYKYQYADLGDIMDAVREPLSENNLFLSQQVSGNYLVTKVYHKDGQWIASYLALPTQSAPQVFGSGMSYMRRYGVCGILNLVAEADDDGVKAQAHHEEAVAPLPPRELKMLGDEVVSQASRLMREANLAGFDNMPDSAQLEGALPQAVARHMKLDGKVKLGQVDEFMDLLRMSVITADGVVGFEGAE